LSIPSICAKISLNFTTKLYGINFVEDSTFNDTKQFVLGGINNNLSDMGYHFQILTPDKPSPFSVINTTSNGHWIMLTYQQGKLPFVIKFYGVGGYIINLGNKRPLFTLDSFDLLKIDYMNRNTKRFEPKDLPKIIKKY